MARHKHYDVIVAFAEGKQIQFKDEAMVAWEDWPHSYAPAFFNSTDYRVKPDKPAMSQADVLAFFDELLAMLERTNSTEGTRYPATKEARTAIAEVYAQRDALVEAAEAELVEVERRERLGAIRPEERGTVDCLRAALARCAGEKS